MRGFLHKTYAPQIWRPRPLVKTPVIKPVDAESQFPILTGGVLLGAAAAIIGYLIWAAIRGGS